MAPPPFFFFLPSLVILGYKNQRKESATLSAAFILIAYTFPIFNQFFHLFTQEKLFSSKNRTETSVGKKLKIDMLPEIEKVHKVL